MAFTGDLEQLHITDIIQLIHTARKSGTFSVKGSRGESRIIFSNGYIVGASHLDNSVRIGTVLVRMNAITPEDLKQALGIQKKAGKDRKPLITTLIHLGKLSREDAFKGLKKLIEITIVELIGWDKGAFTFDTEAIAVSPDCWYLPGKMEQEMSLDAQMVLIDALRVFDERERDRRSEKEVPSYEEFFVEVIPSEGAAENEKRSSVLTADDLGLADLDRLENRILQPASVVEIFGPARIHRQKIRETLAEFSTEEQEAFISFLEKSTGITSTRDLSSRQDHRAQALILFSKDELIKHSVMTICKNEGILVFAMDEETELDSIMAQCLLKEIAPILVFDNPGGAEGLTEEKIVRLRRRARERYPQVSILQLAAPWDHPFTLQSFRDGIRAAFPKPSREDRKKTFVADLIQFLEIFRSYMRIFISEQNVLSKTEEHLRKLKDRIAALRGLNKPPEVSFALLQYVAETFERAITFIVRPTGLIGERAIGVNVGKTMGPTSAAALKIPLTDSSVFHDVIKKGQAFLGEGDDEILTTHLFDAIGAPLRPTILLLPVKSRGRIITLTYGDFGGREASPVHMDMLEILAFQAGVVLENALYREQIRKTAQT